MNLLKKYPFFLLLLPIFFVLHGYTENYDSVRVKESLVLTIFYILAALVIAFISWLYFRSIAKASLIAFALLAYHFFFGSIQDLLRKHFTDTFIARYSFILPVSVLLFILLIIWLKRTKKPLARLTLYLNMLLIILIVVDIVWLGNKIQEQDNSTASMNIEKIVCDTCRRPDIYFIILDGYSGNNALKGQFAFDNSPFERELRNRNFYVAANSRSNYNYTPFSLASLLNMRYLELDMETKGPGNLNNCYQMIRKSNVLNFLEANGYKFHNYSIFDFEGQPAIHSDNFLSTRTRLITSQTFLSRIWKDISFNIGTGKWKIKPISKKIIYEHLHNNNTFSELTRSAPSKPSPKFIYTHLMMPHYPYYFDSRGRALPYDSLVEGKQHSKQNYVEYLQYCNGEILKLTDSILSVSASPTVIILAGDHGFRYYGKKEDRKYCFENLTAVLLPTGNYRQFYDSMSLVNLFPVIFNAEFGQEIPLKKDSTIYLWD